MTPVAAEDLAVDRELASIGESFRLLVDLTPTNVEEEKKAFLASPTGSPHFVYRDLEDLPEVIGARLGKVDVAPVKDPILAHLFGAKRRELSLQLEMLSARDSSDFLSLSTELYGSVPPLLEQQARQILSQVAASRTRGRRLGAEAFARKATAEIDHYRTLNADLVVRIEIRDDISGIMVANGDLLVAITAKVEPSRLVGVLAHEIGTHVLTYFNGSRQPLKLLAAGLAGYEETQEGLALIAEALVGGLTNERLRQVAARVVAVHRLIHGASFTETHSELVHDFDYTPGAAFNIVMRVYRGGGLTKDAIYLRGLQALVEYLAGGKTLTPLWLGKLPLVDLALLEDLAAKEVLHAPALLPRFFEDPLAQERLRNVASNVGLHTLIGAQV